MKKHYFIAGLFLIFLNCQEKQNIEKAEPQASLEQRNISSLKNDEKLFLEFYYGMTSQEINTVVSKLKSSNTISTQNGKNYYALNIGKETYLGELYFNVNNPNLPNKLHNISMNFTNLFIENLMKKRVEGWKISENEIITLTNIGTEMYNNLFDLYKKKYGVPKVATDEVSLEKNKWMKNIYEVNKEEFGKHYHISDKKLKSYMFEDKNKVIIFSSTLFGLPTVSYELKSTMLEIKKSTEDKMKKKEQMNNKSEEEI